MSRLLQAAGSGYGVRPRVAVGLITGVAFFARLLHVLSYDPGPTGAMSTYVDMATTRLALHNLFNMAGFCWLPPGYAFFLKPFFLVFPSDAALAAIRVAQAALGAWTCLLVYRLGRRLHSKRAGLAAALMACFYPHFLFYSSVYLNENLFIPLYLAALLLFLRCGARCTPGRLFRSGLVAACAILVRPIGVSLAPAALLAVGRAGRDARGRLRAALLVAAGAATLMLPWTVRNFIAYGRFVSISPSSAFELAADNHPDGISTRAPEAGEDPWARTDRVGREAAEFARRDPWGVLAGALDSKWPAFWELRPPGPLASSNPQLFIGEIFLPFISWQSVLILGALGVGFLIARRSPGDWVTPACFVVFLAYCLVYSSGSKARLPVESLFLAWAGMAVAEAAAHAGWLRRTGAPAWAAAAAIFLAAALAWSAYQAARARAFDSRPEEVIARAGQIPVVATGPPISIFGKEAIPVGRDRAGYLRFGMNAYRSGPARRTPGNGMVRITFIDEHGQPLKWTENPGYYLEAVPADRWVPIEFKTHIPTAAVSCRVRLTPDPTSPDVFIIDGATLRYALGNDAAFEFLFPYLRFKE